MRLTQDEFINWVRQLERAQEELATMQSEIICGLGEHKKMMLQVLAALAESNRLLDQSDSVELARMLRKGGSC